MSRPGCGVGRRPAPAPLATNVSSPNPPPTKPYTHAPASGTMFGCAAAGPAANVSTASAPSAFHEFIGPAPPGGQLSRGPARGRERPLDASMRQALSHRANAD